MNNKTHQQTHDNSCDNAGAVSQACLESRQALYSLEEEIGDLLKCVERSPDQKDVDTDTCEDTVMPETIWDESSSTESLLPLDP